MIKMEGITKTYKLGDVEVNALRGVNLDVKQGEMVAIMGPSGSGKSTLMNIIGCLDQQTSGSYELDGLNVGRLNDNQLATIRNKKLGFVFQTYNLLPRTPALANVELPLIYNGARNRRQRALVGLERVGLGDRVNHKPAELSGGQQQRVCIARAIINDPAIILADEPTGNLDTCTGEEIMDIFTELNRNEGITIVMVTHEREIAEYCERIIYIRDGIVGGEEVLKR
ncbi:MAG: ABC transporter ATP-binding protein [Chloroflexi bacterium]|nr:ABC transporter ATP-binding protein [Chloroflexota bacterium]